MTELVYTQRGYTIVELIVVFAVVAVVASFTVVGMMRYGYAQQFTSAVTTTSTLLEEARAKARATVDGGTHGVYITSTSTVQFTGDFYSPSTLGARIEVIPDWIQITPTLTDGTTTIIFSRVRGEPSATGTIEFINTRTGTSKTITIFDSGLVQ